MEAIRLKNLLILREEVLPAVGLFFESPHIYMGEVPSEAELELNRKRGFRGHLLAYVAFHLAIVISLVFVVETARIYFGIGATEPFFVSLIRWDSQWRWLVLVVSLVMFLLVLPFTVGCKAHEAAVWLVQRFVSVLVAIERGTPSGATGLAGALIFSVGSALQIIGVWD